MMILESAVYEQIAYSVKYATRGAGDGISYNKYVHR